MLRRMGRRRVIWTDDRVDDLNNRVDRLSERMEAGFARVDADLRALNGRFDGFQQTMLHGFIATWAAMFTGFAALAALILSQT